MRAALVLLVASSVSCWAPFAMYQAARARAPRDLGCPADEVRRNNRGTSGWVFSGCGRTVVYHCMWSSQSTQCFPIWLE